MCGTRTAGVVLYPARDFLQVSRAGSVRDRRAVLLAPPAIVPSGRHIIRA